MSAERDLEECLKLVPEIEKEVSRKAPTLGEQASFLAELINDKLASSDRDKIRTLASLCLLSEICGAIDFDRMVEARERFQAMYPEHFASYLMNMVNMAWRFTWPGCLECANYDGHCLSGATPVEMPEGRSRFDKRCRLKKPRRA